MIRDYFRFPQRQGARPQDERRHPSDRRYARDPRENVDWDRWQEAEALRWNPRHPRQQPNQAQEDRYFDEGYGYGDSYFGDDQRAEHPRFQEGWEGSYRSTPWTLGAELIAPGLHGPYGGRSQPYNVGQQTWFGEEEEEGSRNERYRRQPQGLHRGAGPQSYTRSDERIREDVCDRLTDHPEVDARKIDITVENGVVLLQGTVSDRAMKYGAEDCSWRVSGVKDVDNRVRVERGEASFKP